MAQPPIVHAETEAEKRRGRWLGGFLGISLLATVAYMVAPLGLSPMPLDQLNPINRFVIPGIALIFGLPTLVLAVRGRSRLAARLVAPLMLITSAGALAVSVEAGEPLQIGLSLAFMAYPVLFACMFLSTWETLAVAVVSISTPLMMSLLATGIAAEAAGRGLEFIGFFAMSSVLISHLRTQDLADLRREVSQRAELQAKMVIADRLSSLGVLAAGAGHEMNNAMTYLMGNLELAAELPDEDLDLEELRACLADALEGANQVALLIGDLTRLGRTNEPAQAQTDPCEAVNSVLRLVRPLVIQRARLAVEMADAPAVAMSGVRLGQVVLNLIHNAAQALPEDSTAEEHLVTVRVSRTDEGAASIEVEDDGPGMTAAVQARAFEPFFTTKDDTQGSGLGLHICAELVRTAGGSIQIDSAQGSGTRVHITLPAVA